MPPAVDRVRQRTQFGMSGRLHGRLADRRCDRMAEDGAVPLAARTFETGTQAETVRGAKNAQRGILSMALSMKASRRMPRMTVMTGVLPSMSRVVWNLGDDPR